MKKEFTASEMKKSIITWLIIFSGMASWTMFAINQVRRIFYDQMIEGLGVTHTELGVLYSAFNLASMILYFPGGMLADKVRLKYLVPASLMINGILLFIMSTMPSMEIMTVLYIIFAISSAFMFWATKFKLVKMISTDETYAKNIGLSYGGFAVVGLLMSVVLTYFYSLFSAESGLVYTFYLCAGLSVALSVLSFFTIPLFKGEISSKTDGKKFDLKDTFAALRYPAVWYTAICMIFTYTIYSTTYITSPYLSGLFGASVVFVSVFGTIRSYGVNVISAPIMGFVSLKLKSTTKMTYMSQIVVLGGLIAFMIFPREPGLAIVVAAVAIIWNFVVYGLYSVNSAILTEFAIPAEIFGAASGLLSVIGFLPDVFVPTIFGSILDTQGDAAYNTIFTILAVCSVGLLIVSFMAHKAVKKQKTLNIEQ